MSPTERARDRRLLIELSRINNDYGVRQREVLRDLARSQHELADARGVLGAVAHDLRTPLQAVVGFTEFLLDEELEPEQRDLVERIAHSGVLMSQLTDELLRTISGRQAEPSQEPVDLARILEELTSRCNLLAARSGPVIVSDVAVPADLRIVGDPARLRRAIDNLISNAIKFSPADGTVHVTLALREEAVELTVSDDGPGIDPSEHDAVFAPFHRAAGSEAVSGVGLGLSIVKQIVEQHGGTVAVDSTVGHGATFVVRLPLTRSS